MDQLVYDYAMKFVGIPYRWNGKNPIDGFDCSGLVQEILTAAGFSFKYPLTAQMIYDMLIQSGAKIKAPGEIPQAGMLVFYGNDTSNINHVGFLLDESRMIEAGGGDHTVLDKTSASARNAFVKVKHFSVMKDIVAIVMPRY